MIGRKSPKLDPEEAIRLPDASRVSRITVGRDAPILSPRTQSPNGDAPLASEQGEAEPAAWSVPSLGRLPVLALSTGAGLAICSVVDALSRATLAPSIWFFWAGIAVIVAPIAYRLCAEEASPGERIALVCMLGMGLYVVKLMRDPSGYTMPDEFFHAFNAEQIVRHHKLFTYNSGLAVSARYPGLEGATSALMSLTGMSSFGAGVIVIGAARLMLMLALLMLFLTLSRSWRIAGLGAAAFTGNSNFLLWGAQFSYESLALPLLVVVLALVAQRAARIKVGIPVRAWSIPISLTMVAIVITHHLTSYLVAVVLLVLSLASWALRKRFPPLKLWPLTFIAWAAVAIWLVVVASVTVGYISPVVTAAFKQTIHTLLGESAPRVPFQSGGGAPVVPVGEKVLSFAALAVLALALPYGLRGAWRRRKRDPIALLLCIAGLGFFGVLGLRLAPSAWEIANRTGEFLFIGLALVIAYAIASRPEGRRIARRIRLTPLVVAGCAAIVVVGDAIAGWAPNAVLAAPVRILAANGHPLESDTIAAGHWVYSHLRGARFGAPEAESRTILLYGDSQTFAGPVFDLRDILSTPVLGFQLSALRKGHIHYIVVDDRQRAADNALGYGFSVSRAGGGPDRLFPSGVSQKFAGLPAPLVFNSGHIQIFDLTQVP